jgi:hypothetical protein
VREHLLKAFGAPACQSTGEASLSIALAETPAGGAILLGKSSGAILFGKSRGAVLFGKSSGALDATLSAVSYIYIYIYISSEQMMMRQIPNME